MHNWKVRMSNTNINFPLNVLSVKVDCLLVINYYYFYLDCYTVVMKHSHKKEVIQLVVLGSDLRRNKELRNRAIKLFFWIF